VSHVSTGGGVAASHDGADGSAARAVGTATDNEWNTFTIPLVPVACWLVNDMRFDFGSSVVRPEIAEEIGALAKVREENRWSSPEGTVAYPRLSVFGHSDPVGNDEYNKQLSGRRAKAIYAMLTRRVDLWEQLYSQPLAGDDWRDSMELKRFGSEHGIRDRRALFRAYMDAICGPAVHFDPAADFLCGKDPGGKGDYQGCSEFNPVRLLGTGITRDDATRNEQNARNRRVLVFMFHPGTRVLVERWPCPRAAEGPAGCRKRFWSDGEQRRKPAAEDREYVRTKDTFACRFYDRLSFASPCDGVTSIYANWLPDPVDPVDADTSRSTYTRETISD
jgi:hypothetical protein